MSAAARAPIRVLWVAVSLEAGGAERQMVALAKHLHGHGFDIDVILMRDAGGFTAEMRATGVRVRSLEMRSPGSASVVRAALTAAIGLARYLWWARRGRYHVVDAWLQHPAMLATLTRRLTGIPTVIAGRRSSSRYKTTFGRLRRVADRRATAWCDVIVANAVAVKADVVRWEDVPPGKVWVIHNGVDPITPLGATERVAQRAAWGATDDTIVIGSVANLRPEKGLGAAIAAVAELRGLEVDVRLVIVGEGRERFALTRLIEDLDVGREVRLHGPAADARPLYPAFDIALQASVSEGLPNAVLEAAAAGLPIVATDVGGTSEIIGEGAGILVPAGDVEAMTRALSALIGSSADRVRLGAAARAASARFSHARMADAFAALYRAQVEARGARPPSGGSR